MLVALKDLALNMGRTPTRDEFVAQIRGGKSGVERQFGTYSAMLHAAGFVGRVLATQHKEEKKDILAVDIREFLKDRPHQKALHIVKRNGAHIVFVPDIHFPFVEPNIFTAFYVFLATVVKPGERVIIVVLGDLFDMLSWTKFPKSMLVMDPEQEWNLARELAEKFFIEMRRICPNAEIFLLNGNHDVRPLRRILERDPASEFLIRNEVKKIFTFDGVTTLYDPRDHLLIQGEHADQDIVAHHGFGAAGSHRDKMISHFVRGHDHRQYILSKTTAYGPIIEMSCGLFGDPTTKCFGYTPMKIENWQRGWAWWNEWGPSLCSA